MNIYDTNETMRLLGKQYMTTCGICDAGAKEGLKDINEVHKVGFDNYIDFYMFGYIMGKRVERKRRKDKEKLQ